MSDKMAQAILAVATAPPQKSSGVAAALWFFLAGFGGPWWYLGKIGSAIGAMILYWICTALAFVGVGLVLLPILWIVDGLAVWSSVRKHNMARERALQLAIGQAS